MFTIHATDIRTYLSCQRKFKYGMVDRIVPEDYKEASYFSTGTAGHLILKTHYQKGDVESVIAGIDSSLTEKIKNYEINVQQTLKVLYSFYKDYYKDIDSNFEIATIEDELEVIFEGVKIIFTIDLSGLNHKGPKPYYQIKDHKFYATFPNELALDFDFQGFFYPWACNKLGLNVKELELNVIRKSCPTYPTILKSGGLSKSQAELNSTEYDLYLHMINLIGDNPKDYEAELNTLKNRGSNFLKRYVIKKSERQLEIFEEQLRFIIKEIRQKVGYVNMPHIPDRVDNFIPIGSFDCGHCPYNFLCKVQSSGGDVERTKRALFKDKEPGVR